MNKKALHPIVEWLDDEIRLQQASDAGLTVRSICDAAGVSRPTVDNWRRFGCVPSVAAVDALARVLGYRLAFIDADGDVLLP